MKKKIFGDDICTFHFDSEKKILFSHWKEKTRTLLDEQFKKILLETELKFVKQYRPNGYFLDTRSYLKAIDPNLQQWIADNIFDKWPENNLVKAAFMVSNDLFASVSLEQLFEENKKRELQIRYFENEVEAMNWLE